MMSHLDSSNSQRKILSNSVHDVLKTYCYSTFQKVIQFYHDVNYSSFSVIKNIPNNEFKNYTSKISKSDFLNQLYQFVVKFEQFTLVFHKFKSRCLSLPHNLEFKKILIDIADKFLIPLVDENIDWLYKELNELYMIGKNSKYLKFFTHIQEFPEVIEHHSKHNPFANSLVAVRNELEKLILFIKQIPFFDNDLDSEISTLTYSILRNINAQSNKLNDLIDKANSLNFYNNSPNYQEYLALTKIKENELMTFHEYLFEIKLMKLGIYKPSAKKATKWIMNKNLETIYRIISIILESLEDINDAIDWIIRNYLYELTVRNLDEDYLIKQSHTLSEDITNINNSINEYLFNNLKSLLVISNCKRVEKPDLLNNIKFFYPLLVNQGTLYASFQKLDHIFNRLNKEREHWNNKFVYLIFDQQFSALNTILNNILNIFEINNVIIDNNNNESSLDKFIKNDGAVNDLYDNVKKFVKLSEVIKLNQNNIKKENLN